VRSEKNSKRQRNEPNLSVLGQTVQKWRPVEIKSGKTHLAKIVHGLLIKSLKPKNIRGITRIKERLFL
jgi:hypothetical protein